MSQDKSLHAIGIIGVRDVRRRLYTDGDYINKTLDDHLRKHGLTPTGIRIVTGGGKGTEQLVIEWCRRWSVGFETVPPNIQALGWQKAFSTRNARIVATVDQLVLFWDGYTDNLGECIISAMHMKKVATVYPAI